MDDMARLVAAEHIKELKARYFRFVDTKDWAGLRSLFCDHATLHYTDSNPDTGPQPVDQAMVFIGETLADAATIHHGHMPEIEILTSDTARAIWAMEDRVFWPEGSRNPYGLYQMQGWGHYHETYERHGEQWLIATLKLTRLRRLIELQPARAL